MGYIFIHLATSSKYKSSFYRLVQVDLLIQLNNPIFTLEIIDGVLFIVTSIERYTEFSVKYFLCACCYILALIFLGITVAILAFKKLQGTISEDQGVSRKLTKIALISGFVYSGILLFTLVNLLASQFLKIPDALQEVANCIVTSASDLMTLSLPYILLIFDTNLKKDIRLSRESSSVDPARPDVS
ncbi:hypothetical protein B9Z55_018067 [Caenorhabditis nigoni]|nr:hypothetical protein B9Z55_018067 [Caenorhabditis nigoni]